MMTETKFRNFLAKDHILRHLYKRDGIKGLISVWIYKNTFVVKKEECEENVHWDEGNLLLDCLFRFPDIDAVLEYLSEIGVNPSQFKL